MNTKTYIAFGIISILFSLLFWYFFFTYKQTNIEDLINIKGELVSFRQGESKKSLLISLANYPNNEFSFGESYGYEDLMNKLESTKRPVLIELDIQKSFFDKNRAIIPAFYGLWINDDEIKSNEEGFKVNRDNRRIMLIMGAILSIGGLILLIVGRKKAHNLPDKQVSDFEQDL